MKSRIYPLSLRFQRHAGTGWSQPFRPRVCSDTSLHFWPRVSLSVRQAVGGNTLSTERNEIAALGRDRQRWRDAATMIAVPQGISSDTNELDAHILSNESAVLRVPLTDFVGTLEVPALACKMDGRGTHRVFVSIFPPALVDVLLKSRLLEFFEVEFNAEDAGAIAGAIEGSTVFLMTLVPDKPARPRERATPPTTIIGALLARLDVRFGLYSSYLLTRPGSPSQVLFPNLGAASVLRRRLQALFV
mgnify:CR=1 FL=1